MTDIVVLVVAANDGVQQQTVEAIKHSIAAKVKPPTVSRCQPARDHSTVPCVASGCPVSHTLLLRAAAGADDRGDQQV